MSAPLPAWFANAPSDLVRNVPLATGWVTASITPGWVLAALVTGGFLFLLYVYERRHAVRPGQRRAWLFRLATAMAVLLLLAEPQWVVRRPHRPSVVVLIDDSASMATPDAVPEEGTTDSIGASANLDRPPAKSRLAVAQRLLAGKDGLLETLPEKYELLLFAVGKSARRLPTTDRRDAVRTLRPTGTSSRLGEAVRRALEMSAVAEPEAAVLLSDGITTGGITLHEYVSGEAYRGVPLYIVGLGGARPIPDVAVESVSGDSPALMGDPVDVEARIRVTGFKGQTVEARLRDADSQAILARRPIVINRAASSQVLRFQFPAADAGQRRIVVEVPVQSGEARKNNNRRMGYLQVTPGPVRVLILESRPRYEFRYIRSALRDDERVQLTTILSDADAEIVEHDPAMELSFPQKAAELLHYDVVILGDIDPHFAGQSAWRNLWNFVEQHAGGVIFICGPRFMPVAYQPTTLGALLPISPGDYPAAERPNATTMRYVVPTPLGRSTLFRAAGSNIEQGAHRADSKLSFYGAIPALHVKPGALVLAEADGGADRERQACVVMQYVGAGKVLLQAVDQTWRWQPGSLSGVKSHWWNRVVRRMARSRLGIRSGRGRLAVDRLQYNVGDPVRLTLEAGGETSYLAAPPVTIVSDQGIRRRVALQRDPYFADRVVGVVGDLAAGEYQARVDTASAGESALSTRFTVRPASVETRRVAVDPASLRQIARETRGEFYQPATAHRLGRDLPDADRASPVERVPLASGWWVIPILISLLGAEWFVRRWNGMT